MKNKIYILLFIIGLSYSSCKKYPENTLWFKKVKKLYFFNRVKLVSYKINGDESINTLNNYFGSKITVKDINTVEFGEEYDRNLDKKYGVFTIPNNNSGYHLPFYYDYIHNKKKIKIYFNTSYNCDTTIYSRSPFVEESTEWDIIKFDPKGTRKIKATINSNVYEMEFNAL